MRRSLCGSTGSLKGVFACQSLRVARALVPGSHAHTVRPSGRLNPRVTESHPEVTQRWLADTELQHERQTETLIRIMTIPSSSGISGMHSVTSREATGRCRSPRCSRWWSTASHCRPRRPSPPSRPSRQSHPSSPRGSGLAAARWWPSCPQQRECEGRVKRPTPVTVGAWPSRSARPELPPVASANTTASAARHAHTSAADVWRAWAVRACVDAWMHRRREGDIAQFARGGERCLAVCAALCVGRQRRRRVLRVVV